MSCMVVVIDGICGGEILNMPSIKWREYRALLLLCCYHINVNEIAKYIA